MSTMTTLIETGMGMRDGHSLDPAPSAAPSTPPSKACPSTPVAHKITSWGRVKRVSAARIAPAFSDQLPAILAARPTEPLLAIGLGRSYGDSGLNSGGAIVDMTALDRILAFDPATGIIRAEAGLSLSDLLRIVVPYGWFLPTTPGTRFVTLGGAVANDVHGKNHHAAGTFGASVRRIGIHRSDAGFLEISTADGTELFRATIAGLGLTGLIAWVELQLVRVPGSCIGAENVPFGGYAEFAAIAQESAAAFEHTVAWIDCTTGRDDKSTRGLFSRGNWLPDGLYNPHADRTSATLPLELPGFAINALSLRAFNTLYYKTGALKRGRTRTHYAPFFYPLDAIRNWNRAYGRAGFYQYQCVVPPAAADTAIPEMLGEIARSGLGSCLAVLKTFGDKPSPGMLSFPFEGVTLALDFPNRKARTHQLFERLDAIVSTAHGRLYPAKDGRMPASLFRAGYPALERFTKYVDPAFKSDFWRRMNP
jgi:FAD/FMN-containing dehydrogenase